MIFLICIGVAIISGIIGVKLGTKYSVEKEIKPIIEEYFEEGNEKIMEAKDKLINLILDATDKFPEARKSIINKLEKELGEVK